MLRCGTSIGANVRESKAAQSTADFISKLKIALKEGDECIFWLELLHETDYLTDSEFNSIYNDNKQINATLVKIINSTLNH
jgi:four helix bundle protein